MTTAAMASRRQGDDEETAGSWSNLPDEPLHNILMRLCSLVDLISFKSVCRSWRAFASSLSPSVITSRFPPFLLVPKRSDGFWLSSSGVYDPSSPSFFSSLSLNSDKFKHLGIVSYSHSHLLSMLRYRVVIINLLTGAEFYSPIFPKIDSLSDSTDSTYIRPTFCMLTSPFSSPDSGLLVFTTGPLLYWQKGSASWSCHWPKTKITGQLGVVTVQGKVYAMNSLDYSLYVLDLSPELHLRPLEVEGIKKDSSILEHFLVDCGGELLHVQLVKAEDWHTRSEAFLLDMSVNGPRWVKKETLGNWAIFVGYHFRLPGLAVENPERWGGRSNCIYYNKVNENRDPPYAVSKLGDALESSYQDSLYYCSKRLSSIWFHPVF